MKIAITYIFPNGGAGGYFELALRFLQTYHDHPPGMEHDSVIVCNGAPAIDETMFLFGSLPNLTFLNHDNSGYDIGGFQAAARSYPCDLMVFFGTTAYLRLPGWLKRMVQAFERHGDTLYGSTGNQGQLYAGVHPHVRTTGFWIRPELFNQYPVKVTQPHERYPFEHGPGCLTSYIMAIGKQPWIIGGTDDFTLQACDSMPGGFHSNSQEQLLVGDRLTMPPYFHCP